MAIPKIETIMALERQVWQALARGDASVDATLLSDDFLGVYESGMADKADHVGQLAAGPVVSTFQISQPVLKVFSDDLVLLAYRADFERPGRPAQLLSMYVGSVWQHVDDGWVNVFSQDTAVAHSGQDRDGEGKQS